ncbi:uncharacterized protein LOC132286412 [Cornus florida]|uniref:uncharacterized protein LOC132286412 n=1 Tax=Cornus florida TaxID=4283 RepID=UPI00289A1E9F|nr:uncharacterized protein LOC132286412 [Cornus florida]
MKREGRQHGVVRNYPILPLPWNTRPESNYVNKFHSPPTFGLFTKVSSKPTNHSKFTGKCGRPKCAGCHLHPACKSKPKAKGTQKNRSRDVAGLVTSRVVDGKPGLNFAGFSATWILDHLDNDYLDDNDDDVADVYFGSGCYSDDVYDHEGSCGFSDCDLFHHDLISGSEIASGAVEIREDNNSDDAVEIREDNNSDDDDNMSFCDVGFVWEQVDGDEGWCLVGEM